MTAHAALGATVGGQGWPPPSPQERLLACRAEGCMRSRPLRLRFSPGSIEVELTVTGLLTGLLQGFCKVGEELVEAFEIVAAEGVLDSGVDALGVGGDSGE